MMTDRPVKAGALRTLTRTASVLFATGILLYAGWWELRTWHKDFILNQLQQSRNLTLRRQEELLHQARQLRPDLSPPWQESARVLSFSDPRQALIMARQAVRLNPNNWNNWRTLGMIQFQLGDFKAAKAALIQAARFDRGFAAHYQLANFSWLLGKQSAFWREMKAALRIAPSEDVSRSIETIFRLGGPHPQRLISILPPRRVAYLSAALTLADTGYLKPASQLWSSLRTCPEWRRELCHKVVTHLIEDWLQRAGAALHPPSASLPFKPQITDQLSAAQHALQIWNQAVELQVLPASSAKLGQITDGAFNFPPIGLLAWSESPAVMMLRLQSFSRPKTFLELRFGGWERSPSPITQQWVAMEPANCYRISYLSRGRQMQQGDGGVFLSVIRPAGNVLATIPAPVRGFWQMASGRLIVPAGVAIVRVGFGYKRPLGSMPLEGWVDLTQVNLRPTACKQHSASQY